MTKIQLRGQHITFTVVLPNRVEVFEIKNGNYNNTRFTYAIINDTNIILEGDTVYLLKSGALSIYIKIESVADKIASILQNSTDIYLSGIEAIPEGKKREILSKIL